MPKQLQKRYYNRNYNLYPVRNTSVSKLLGYIQQQRLSDVLEALYRLGFVEDEVIVVLDSLQTLQGLGGVA